MATYIAKQPDKNGIIAFSETENETWATLIKRQDKIVEHRACEEYLYGLNKLNLPREYIPQCKDINSVLLDLTGWSVLPVPALIPVEEFYQLLANRQFPAASFIRNPDELDYLKEPDIFHEIYGHIPLLTNQSYADFMCWYGKTALKATVAEAKILSRLFWFTIEFGLIKQNNEFKIYGGGILSSKQETIYSVESDIPQRVALDPLLALQKPYRYDVIQELYFYITNLEDLYKLQEIDLLSLVKQVNNSKKSLRDKHFC
jgi:phenylalanine-4-hydroxylase